MSGDGFEGEMVIWRRTEGRWATGQRLLLGERVEEKREIELETESDKRRGEIFKGFLKSFL